MNAEDELNLIVSHTKEDVFRVDDATPGHPHIYITVSGSQVASRTGEGKQAR